MKTLRLLVLAVSLFTLTLFTIHAVEREDQIKVDPVSLEKRLTILEDFMAETRRSNETMRTIQVGIAVGVAGLLIEMIVRGRKSSRF